MANDPAILELTTERQMGECSGGSATKNAIE